MAKTVRIEDTGIPYGIRSIVEQLAAPDDIRPGDEIILKFRDEFCSFRDRPCARPNGLQGESFRYQSFISVRLISRIRHRVFNEI
jgi:hypothetical protein